MSDFDVLKPLKSYLAAPAGGATAAQSVAWNDFYDTHDPMIRGIMRKRRMGQSDVDDSAQNVWFRIV